jgi:hypothetical protein
VSLGSIAPVPRPQYLDRNGVPLAGAKVRYFDTGTSAPAVVYQDHTLLIPHSDPIICDAAGRQPAVYLPSGSFKMLVMNAFDVPQFTVDPVQATHSGQSGEAGDVKVLGGDPTSPVTVTAYPTGTGFDKTHAGSIVWSLDAGDLPAGTYALEGMLFANGGGTVTAGLVNLSDGTPDTALVEISSASVTGARVRSGPITFPAAGIAKDLAVKTKVTSGAGMVWGLSIVKTG